MSFKLDSSGQESLENLDHISKFLNDNQVILKNEQDDSDVMSILDAEYNLSKAEKQAFQEMLSGRRKRATFSKRERQKIIKDLKAYLHLSDIRMPEMDDSSDPIDVDKLKKRVAAKKHAINKELEQQDG